MYFFFFVSSIHAAESFGGLGIVINKEENLIKINSIRKNSPAEKDGLQIGDYISHVDKQSVQNLTLDEAIILLRGDVGSKVVITILRNSDIFDVTIVRNIIKIEPINHGIQLLNEGKYKESYEILIEIANQGDAEAQNYIGLMYFYGHYVEKNINLSHEWIQKSANQGFGWAEFNLADFYLYKRVEYGNIDKAYELLLSSINHGYLFSYNYLGLIHEELNLGYHDINKAIEYYEKGNDLNIPFSQYQLCVLYSEGLLINQDINKAIVLCKKSAEQDFIEAQYHLGQIYNLDIYNIKKYEEGFYWTKLAAEEGHALANWYLGILYSIGMGTNKDPFKSHQHTVIASEFNIPESYSSLSYNYHYGKGAEIDIKKAIYYNLKTIDFPVSNKDQALQNTLNAYGGLYAIYRYKKGFIDNDKAFKYIKLLVSVGGKANDYTFLAHAYKDGIGTKINYIKALELYEIAFSKGDKESSIDIGRLYFHGLGVEINYDRAVNYYNAYIKHTEDHPKERMAIGLSIIYSDLARIYREGLLGKIDFKLAFEYSTKSYEYGYDYESLYIGEMYYEGSGMNKNINKAIEWLNIANNISHSPVAMEILGNIYEYEKNDFEKAFNFYLKGAELDYSNASFNVGRFYEKGIYVKKDLDTAAFWFQKSAEQGLINGAHKLAKLHSLNLLSNSSKKQEEYWLNYALNMDKGKESIASTILARQLITGEGREKDVELGLQYLTNAALDDPTMIKEILLISKNKIINKKQSIDLFNAIKEDSLNNNLAKTSLAIIYNDGGLYQKKDTDKFLKLTNEIINSPLEELSFHHGMAYMFLAQHYSLKGDNLKTESLLREGVLRFPNDTDYNLSRQLLIFYYVAFLQSNGELNKALIFGKNLLEDLVGDIFDEISHGLINCAIAEILYLQKNYQESLNYTAVCLSFTSQSNMNDNNMFYLKYKLMESVIYANLNEITISKDIYEEINNEIVRFMSTSFFAEGIIQLLAFEGDLFYLWGDNKKTISKYQEIENIIEEENIPISATILSGSISYFKAMSELNQNDKALRLSQKLINDYLKNNSVNSNNFLLRDFHETYLNLLYKVYTITNDHTLLEESFIISQVAKNDSLSKQISQTLFSISSNDKELRKLINKKQGLEFQINNIEKFNQEQNFSGTNNQDMFLNKSKIWNKLHKALSKTLKKINNNYPDYHSLIMPNKYPFEEISKILNDEELLLVTFTGYKNSYVWFIFNDYLYLQKIDITKKQLSSYISNVRSSLDQSDIVNANQLRPFDFKNSYILYDTIFKNIEKKLVNIGTIYTILDGPFQSLPFEILLKDPIKEVNNKQAYQKAKWLVNDFNFSYLTGVSDLVTYKKLNKKEINFENKYVAFADPDLSNNNTVIRSSINVSQLFDKRGDVNIEEIRNLPSLPETSDEVKNIAKILNSNFENLFLQENANEKNVKTIDLSNTKIISFATHGLVNGEIKGLTEPALVLTPPNETSNIDDGLLKSSEIALLNLNSELVVLSACNTAASDGSLGAEGLSGLAKSFFISGSKAVLVSHWPVFSESTKDTMIDLFAQTQNNNLSYSDSLQQAKILMIKKNKYDLFSHPTFWAPFVMIGIN